MLKLVGPLLERLTTFVFPLLLIALSAVAVLWQSDTTAASGGALLPVRAWEQVNAGPVPSIADVGATAEAKAPALTVETYRSTRPFWFSIDLPARVEGRQVVADFPSRHAIGVACWNGVTGESLGEADHRNASGLISESRAGFALTMPLDWSGGRVLCRSQFRGPAKITAAMWSTEALAKAQRAHRGTGLIIEGAIGVLALFMLLTAVVNASPLYLAFVGGLLLNMRMAALSVGTDFQFFGIDVPADWLIPMRQWTLCLYFANTVGLFIVLFKQELTGARWRLPLTLHQGLAVVFLASAPFVTYESMLPVLWVTSFSLVVVMLCHLGGIFQRTQSRVAAWYGASIVVTLIATLNEVVIAATGQKWLQSGLNSVTAAIASALLASAAVAEHMRNHRLQNKRAQDMLEAAYKDSPIGLFSVGQGSSVIKTNPAFHAMVSPVTSQAITTLSDLFSPDVVQQIRQLHGAHVNATLDFQTKVGGHEGTAQRWFALRASTVDGQIIECSLLDITERVSATERLEFLASHDPLTGCLNLRGLVQETAGKNARPHALAYFDLDRFKLINDLYGHSAGDQVLLQVAQRMRNVLAPADLLARIGGDEFVVVFYGGDMDACESKCNTITMLIGSSPFQIETQSFALDVSGGLVGTGQFEGADLKEIVSAADTLCRMAKKRPYQRMVVMQAGDRFFQQHQDELDLINCLERGETPLGLFLVMQPEISLSRPFDSLNFEMLIRLRKADGSIVPAGTIIEAAEAHGKTAIIDRWVLHTAIQWLETHAQALRNTHFVGVNLSGGSLNDEAFIEELFALFAKHPVALAKICIEITETVAITDMRNMQRFIDRIRSMGGKVALDDFGAGYSSFGYLKGLSVDSLKLDGSLVRDAVRSPAGEAIIVAIGGLVRSLGMKSVGEFAEDLPTIKVLYEAGVDYAQGYGISKPVSAERILAARSGADFIEDESILAFFHQIQAGDSGTMPLFQDSRSSSLH